MGRKLRPTIPRWVLGATFGTLRAIERFNRKPSYDARLVDSTINQLRPKADEMTKAFLRYSDLLPYLASQRYPNERIERLLAGLKAIEADPASHVVN